MGVKLAIDFGATNSLVGKYDGRGNTVSILNIPSICRDDYNGVPFIPSIYSTDGKIGEEVRGLLSKIEEIEEIEKDKSFLKKSVSFVSSLFNKDYLKTKLKQKYYTDIKNNILEGYNFNENRKVLYLFLSKLYREIKKHLGNEKIERIVFSYPLLIEKKDTNKGKRYIKTLKNIVSDVFANTGIEVVFSEELFCACIGQGFDMEERKAIFIIDIGGSTTNLSIATIGGDNDTVLLSRVSYKFGGNDIDKIIQQRVKDGYNIDLDDNNAEAIKIHLSDNEICDIPHTTQKLERATLEEWLARENIYTKIDMQIESVFADMVRKGLNINVNSAILIGGSTLVPSIRDKIEDRIADILSKQNSKITINNSNVFDSVVRGAVWLAAGRKLDPYLNFYYCIRAYNGNGNNEEYLVIFHQGDRAPLSLKAKFNKYNSLSEVIRVEIYQVFIGDEDRYMSGEQVTYTINDTNIDRMIGSTDLDMEDNEFVIKFNLDENKNLSLQIKGKSIKIGRLN